MRCDHLVERLRREPTLCKPECQDLLRPWETGVTQFGQIRAAPRWTSEEGVEFRLTTWARGLPSGMTMSVSWGLTSACCGWSATVDVPSKMQQSIAVRCQS